MIAYLKLRLKDKQTLEKAKNIINGLLPEVKYEYNGLKKYPNISMKFPCHK